MNEQLNFPRSFFEINPLERYLSEENAGAFHLSLRHVKSTPHLLLKHLRRPCMLMKILVASPCKQTPVHPARHPLSFEPHHHSSPRSYNLPTMINMFHECAYNRAVEAIQYESKEYEWSANQKWKEIYGSKFTG